MFDNHSGFGWSGLGWLAAVGLLFIVATEATLRAVAGDPAITAPHSWWLMTGYIVAAAYCIALHLFLKHRDIKNGYDEPGSGHWLGPIPLRYWSVVYIILGLLRVAAQK